MQSEIDGGLVDDGSPHTSDDQDGDAARVIHPRRPAESSPALVKADFRHADHGSADPTGSERVIVVSTSRRVRFWLPPAVLALVLGLWRIGTPSAWTDEMVTWGAASVSWRELFALLPHGDAFLAPYYVLMRAWATVFGTSDVALRLPSLLAASATCGLVAVLGARVLTPRIGLVAGLLLAVTPSISRYAHEQRVYTLVAAIAVLATLLLDRALERPSWRRFAGYAAAVTVMSWLHILALALLAAHGCAVMLRHPRSAQRARLWMCSAATALLLASPLLWAAYVHHSYVEWIPPLRWRALAALFKLIGLPVLGALVIGGAFTVRTGRRAVMVVVGRRAATLLITWATIPVAVLLGVTLVTPVFVNRYVLYVVPAWALLGAAGLERALAGRGFGWPLGLRLGVVLVLVVSGLPEHVKIRQADGHGQASRQAAGVLTKQVRTGDAIVYALPDTGGSWYARDLVARYVPTDRRPRDALAVRPQRADSMILARECVDPAPCLAAAPRVWVLRNGVKRDPLAGMSDAKQRLLRERYEPAHVYLMTGVTLALYIRRAE